jgi:hypothetical protein
MGVLFRGIVQPEEAVEGQKEGIGEEIDGEEYAEAGDVQSIRFLPALAPSHDAASV